MNGEGPAPDPSGAESTSEAEPTAGELIDEIAAAHEAEMAQVQDYLLIEKSKAAPLPDIGYYERKSPGAEESTSDLEFVKVPVHELAQRETLANPDADEGLKHAAENPAAVIGQFAEALDVIGQVLDTELPGVSGATDVAAEGFRDAAGSIEQQETQDETEEGADPMAGVFTKELIGLFHYGMYFDLNGEFVFPPRKLINVPVRCVILRTPSNWVPEPLRYDETGEIETGEIMISNSHPPVPAFPSYLPPGSLVEFGGLRACLRGGDFRWDVVVLAYREETPAGIVRTVIEESRYDWERSGPLLFPRKVQKRISSGMQEFIDELEREIRVNEGLPTQAELAEYLGETMD